MSGSGSESLPVALNNCDLFNAQYSYGYSINAGLNWTWYNADAGGITGMQSHLTSLLSSNNISVSSVGFVDTAVDLMGSNWALTSSTPSSITTGGKNLSTFFTDDKAGATRPATGGWSIGAYQYP
jgi:hypothetical protein